MKDLSYKLENGIYSLYDGDELLYTIGENVSISYTFWEEDGNARGFINKHGSPEMVKAYHNKIVETYKKLSEEENPMAHLANNMLQEHYYIEGKFKLEDLNRFLSISDNIARWHKANLVNV